MHPIRILQVFTTMGRGGAESMIMNYYRHMDRSKVQFDFIVHRNQPAAFDDEIKALGGSIYYLPEINPLFPKQYYQELRKFFKTHDQYNIVHSHINTFSYFPLKIAEEFGIKTRIAHAHIAMDPIDLKSTFKSKSSIIEALKKALKLQLKKNIHKHTTHCFSCGIKAGKWLFGEQTQFRVMNNAVDVNTFTYNPEICDKLKKEFNIENKFVLGHVGRFTQQKNHDYLLKVFSEVLKRDENCVLLLIGTGPLEHDIKLLAKKLNVTQQIKFLGLRTNIAELLQVLDVFIFPSFFEGLPVTLIEAQAAGLKIVASATITDEVKLTNDIDYLSIDASPEIWSQRIISLYPVKKQNNLNLIKNGNYDIKSNALEIEQFYLQQN